MRTFRRHLSVLAVSVVLLALGGGVLLTAQPAGADTTLVASFVPGSESEGSVGQVGFEDAEAFTPDASGPLDSIQLPIGWDANFGSGPGDLEVSVVGLSGGEPDLSNVVADTDVSASQIPEIQGTLEWITVTFSEQPVLQEGTEYAIVVNPLVNSADALWGYAGGGSIPSTWLGSDDYNGFWVARPYAEMLYQVFEEAAALPQLTITAPSISTGYGSNFTLPAPSYQGFRNGDTAASLTTQPTCTTTATSSSPAGSYPVTCSGAADPNYDISYEAGSVTVTADPLTVIAPTISVSQGSVIPNLVPTYQGLVNGDTASSLTTQPTCTTNATTSSPLGSYPVTCSGAADPNYDISYEAGALDVTTYGSPSGTDVASYAPGNPSLEWPLGASGYNSEYLGEAFTPSETGSLSSVQLMIASVSEFGGPGSFEVQIVPVEGGSPDLGDVLADTTTGTLPFSGYPPPFYTVTFAQSPVLQAGTEYAIVLIPTGGSTGASAFGTFDSSPQSWQYADGYWYPYSYAMIEYNVYEVRSATPLTITASSGTMVYGGTPPIVTASYAGLIDGDTPSSLTTQPTCSAGATSSSPVGSYVSSCSGASDNYYDITYEPGSVSVTAAPLTVVGPTVTATYGSTFSLPEPTYEGLVNGDTASSLATQATCTTSASSISPVGSYPVTCSGASDSNYDITYQDGTVTITAPNLTVVGPTLTATYGSTFSLPEPTYEGLVNGDTASSLATQATCTTSASSISPVGSYPVTCSGASDSNYDIGYQDGSVTITPADLTVTGATLSSTYGNTFNLPDPTYQGFVNGDSASSLTTAPSCTTTASATSPVGSYPVTCSGASDPNYQISYEPGAVNVTTAQLTITATPSTSVYGSPPGAVQYAYAGFVNGDTAGSAVTTPPTCTTTVTSSTPAGYYTEAESCSGAVAPNYTIAYFEGDATVAPAPLTVTADNETMVYGGTLPSLTVSYSGFVNGDSSSAPADQATCTTPATASSPAGSYPITCSGVTDPNYDVTYEPGTLTINPAPLTVTADNETMVYGGTLPSLTASYSGFVNGDSSSAPADQATCSTAATSSSGAGGYPITCSGVSDPDYNVTYESGTLTINPALLTVTAPSPSMVYGASLPSLTPTYQGFVNGDSSSAPADQATCTTTATSSSGVGTYGVTCAGVSDPNYDVSYDSGTLRVTPAPLTVTAPSPSMVYGASLPSLTPTYQGFVNGDSSSDPADQATCTSTATSSSAVGTYKVTCSGVTDPNYDVSYEPGTLTVTPASLTVTAKNQTMLFGAKVPSLTVSYSGFVDGDTASVISGSPSCTTTATSASPGGSYPITCAIGSLTAADYTFTFVPGTLTVSYSESCLSGTIRGGYLVGVDKSVCFGPGAQVDGPVIVSPGGSLDIEGATVSGPVTTLGSGTLRICGAEIRGAVSVLGDSGATVIGDGGSCGPSTISGPVTLAGDTRAIEVDGASISGPFSATGDSGGVSLLSSEVKGPVTITFDSGGVTVTDNTINGPLTVSNDTGTVTVSGNHVTGPVHVQ